MAEAASSSSSSSSSAKDGNNATLPLNSTTGAPAAGDDTAAAAAGDDADTGRRSEVSEATPTHNATQGLNTEGEHAAPDDAAVEAADSADPQPFQPTAPHAEDLDAHQMHRFGYRTMDNQSLLNVASTYNDAELQKGKAYRKFLGLGVLLLWRFRS